MISSQVGSLAISAIGLVFNGSFLGAPIFFYVLLSILPKVLIHCTFPDRTLFHVVAMALFSVQRCTNLLLLVSTAALSTIFTLSASNSRTRWLNDCSRVFTFSCSCKAKYRFLSVCEWVWCQVKDPNVCCQNNYSMKMLLHWQNFLQLASQFCQMREKLHEKLTRAI